MCRLAAVTLVAVCLAIAPLSLAQSSQYPKCLVSGGGGGGICGGALTVFCNKLTCGSCCIHSSTCNPNPSIYTQKSQCVVSGCSQVSCLTGTKCVLLGAYGTCVPTCKSPVSCIRQPCQGATCARKPNAVCYDNYCGGCNAEFYLKGQRVNCALPQTIPTSQPTTNSPTKPTINDGSCPRFTGHSICIVSCQGDSSCASDEKCCSQGCAKRCVKSCPSLPCAIRCAYGQSYNATTGCPECNCITKCQSEQQQGSSGGLLGRRRRQLGRFVPQCTKDGSYKTLQCHGSTGYCWCVNPSTGVNTTSPVSPTLVKTLPCFAAPSKPTIGATVTPPANSTHGGYCPRAVTRTPVCRQSCTSDNQCAQNSKCCNLACNQVCTKACNFLPCPLLKCNKLYGRAYNTTTGCNICRCATKCEYTRDQARNSGPGPVGRRRRQIPPGRFVPSCNPDDGSFSPMQCLASSGMCWCVNTTTGVNTTAPTHNRASLPCAPQTTNRPITVSKPVNTTRPPTRGYCPRVLQGSPVCKQACKTDAQCKSGYKCCNQSSCMSCVAACPIIPCQPIACLQYGSAYNFTTGCRLCRCRKKCEYERDQAYAAQPPRRGRRLSLPIGRFVAQCQSSGLYKPLQCHGSTGMCWCVNPQTGVNTTSQTRNLYSLPCASAKPTPSGKPVTCGPVCKLGCPNGLLKDKNGCFICKCAPAPTGSGRPTQGTRRPTPSRKPVTCGPVCEIGCPNGLLKDKNGCFICKCAPSTPEPTVVTSFRCAVPGCANRCEHGYANDKNGCQTCTCRSTPIEKRSITLRLNTIASSARQAIETDKKAFADAVVEQLVNRYKIPAKQLYDAQVVSSEEGVTLTFTMQGNDSTPAVAPFVEQLKADTSSGQLSITYVVDGQSVEMPVSNVDSQAISGSDSSSSSNTLAIALGSVFGVFAIVIVAVLLYKVGKSDTRGVAPTKYSHDTVKIGGQGMTNPSYEGLPGSPSSEQDAPLMDE